MSIPSDHTISFVIGHNLICTVNAIDSDLAALKWSVYAQKNGRYSIVRTRRAGESKDTYLSRVILERILQRTLVSNEICRYIDGNSLNNCRANLRLQTTGLPEVKKYYEPDFTPRKKRCTKCGKDKPVKEFPINRQIKGGIHSWCKECTNRISKEYTDKHPERLETYRESHREQARQYTANWRKNNPDKAKETERKSVLKRSGKIKAYQQKYNANHPEKSKVKNLKYKARKRSLPFNFTGEDWRIAQTHFNYACAYCGKPPSMFDLNPVLHADHFIPIADPNCPGTVKTNMLPACENCNLKKQDTDPHVWLIRRFGKSKATKIEKRIREYFNSL